MKKIINVVVILTTVIILLMLVYKTHGVAGLAEQLLKLNPLWLLVAFTFMLAYWGLETLNFHVITVSLHVRQKLRDSLKVTMIGQFFNSVTPFASGGQPVQMYVMAKDGIEVGNAGSILVIRFLIYHVVLTVYALIVILRAPFLKFYSIQLYYLVLAGFIVHAAMILLLVLFSYNRKITRRLLTAMFVIPKKFKLIKNIEDSERKFEDELEKFHVNATLLKNNVVLLAKTSLLTGVQMTFFFAIPYCIYRSFGFDGASIWNMIAAQVFVSTLMSFVPLPGASGGAEGGFFLFYKVFFSGNTIVTALLIWRIVTYYSCIGFGGLFSLLSPQKPLKAEEG